LKIQLHNLKLFYVKDELYEVNYKKIKV